MVRKVLVTDLFVLVNRKFIWQPINMAGTSSLSSPTIFRPEREDEPGFSKTVSSLNSYANSTKRIYTIRAISMNKSLTSSQVQYLLIMYLYCP